MDNEQFLRNLMKRYTTDNLVGISAEDFREKIDEFLELDDWEMEGYSSPDLQRKESVKFHWGHNHDFGDFKLEGKAGDRHIHLLDKFIEMGLPRDLSGKFILDVGVWTGGTSLLLYGMGAWIEAFEEVVKYSDAINFLVKSFGLMKMGIPSLHCSPCSLYEMPLRSTKEKFNFVIFAGVLYHLTDSILALRIIFNVLHDGGKVFIETACINSSAPRFDYRGPSVPGWNWLLPTKGALRQMMLDVGFEDVEIKTTRGRRAYAVGTRKKHKDMLRAGLSRRDIR